MSILIDSSTRVLVQGITGLSGSFHTLQMLQYKTNIVGGITPGKEKQLFNNQIPIFNSVRDAIDETNANVSIIYVPAALAADAIIESIEAKLELIVCITEGIPTIDMIKVIKLLKSSNTRLIGPNCPGIITPNECKIGIMPGYIHKKGNVGVVSRSGTLTYEAVHQLTNLNIGQSTCVGIGGDAILGTNFIDILEKFNNDDDTKAVVIIGEIGGNAEENAALWIKDNMKKPVIGFIAGETAPSNKRMGHAGAIIAKGEGTALCKKLAFKDAGIKLVDTPSDIGLITKKVLLTYGT